MNTEASDDLQLIGPLRAAGRRGATRRLAPAVWLLATAALSVGCGSSSNTSNTSNTSNVSNVSNADATIAGGAVVNVVTAENFWGSIARELGGIHAHVTSIVNSPDADPHSYEPTPADARTLANARLVIANGVGYDSWINKLVAANNNRAEVIDIGKLVGVAAGGNPHRWYNPADVQSVVEQIVKDLQQLDPADSAYFGAQEITFNTVGLKDYHETIASIKAKYGGTKVGASESIFAMLAPALGLDLITPGSFLKAISEGSDVSASDKATIDEQIKNRTIKIYVYNSQNVTPDVQAQLDAVKLQNIPVATITETLTPATATYEEWQTAQLRGIEAALATAVPGS